MNREQKRRQGRIERRHRNDIPRKATNTLEIAQSLARKLTDAEHDKVLKGVYAAFDKMRRGQWREAEWNDLADMLNVAAALASPGFNLLNDHIHKFHAGMETLAEIAKRVNKGQGWTCYAHEMHVIDTAIEFFEYQMRFASIGEYNRAIDYAANRLRGKTAIAVQLEAA